jgi:hypothetical protein
VTPEQILERERNRALPVAVAAFGGIALIVISIILNQSGGISSSSDDAAFLRDFPDHRSTLLAAAILQGAGTLFLTAPLFFLFQAADARSETMRSALLGLTIAGPLFLAIAAVVQWVGFDQAATAFGTPPHGTSLNDYAQDVIRDQGAYNVAQGTSFAGTLGLVVGVFYTSLNAMRVGLLTRFWGTLGMALAISVLFLSLIGVLVFFLMLGFLILGIWPGPRPPAWETGEAIPWPKAGAESQPSGGSVEPEEPALPPGAAGDDDTGAEAEPSTGDQAPQKRKRRRG